MDYNELVKALREHSKRDNCNCDTCFAYDAETRGYITCSEELTEKAADAIEELQAAVEREKTYTQFWEDAAKTCKVQYEKLQREQQLAEFDVANWRDAYHHWFENYQNDVPKWIPVTERLPEDGQWVLVWGHGQKIPIMMFRESGAWIDDQFEFHTTVTHWMPLPEPPKEETE